MLIYFATEIVLKISCNLEFHTYYFLITSFITFNNNIKIYAPHRIERPFILVLSFSTRLKKFHLR